MTEEDDFIEELPSHTAYRQAWGSTVEDDIAAGDQGGVGDWLGRYDSGKWIDEVVAPTPVYEDPQVVVARQKVEAMDRATGALRDADSGKLGESRRSSMASDATRRAEIGASGQSSAASDATRRAELAQTIAHDKAYLEFLNRELNDLKIPRSQAEIAALMKEGELAQRTSYADLTGYVYTLPGEPTPPPSDVGQRLSQTWSTGSPGAVASGLMSLGQGGR